MTLPLTLLFSIGADSLRSGLYRGTIAHYHRQLVQAGPGFSGCPDISWARLPRPLAYIRLTDAEKPLLSDAVDFCYDHDVAVIAQDGTQLRERGGMTDLHWVLDRPEVQSMPYLFHVNGDVCVQPAPDHALITLLDASCRTLGTNHAILSVGFQPWLSFAPLQRVSETFTIAPAVRGPAVARTRDLYLAEHLTHGRGGNSADVLAAFSHSQARHIAFQTSIATTL